MLRPAASMRTLLLVLLFDMAVKPSWDDSWLCIAVAGFAALAAVLVRHGLRTKLAAAPLPG